MPEPNVLFFDADDTLWENACYFEWALNAWTDLLLREGAAVSAAVEVFEELESRGFRRGWYGSRRLAINMRSATRMILGRPRAAALDQEINSIVDSVRRHDLHFYPGVEETLETLGRRHSLFLVTMGEWEEQSNKIERSGLAKHFDALHVLADKTRQSYDDILTKYRLHPRACWMIGNSMAKDIRPARAAGLKTCYYANGCDFSFGIDVGEIEADLVVSELSDLLRHFSPEPA